MQCVEGNYTAKAAAGEMSRFSDLILISISLQLAESGCAVLRPDETRCGRTEPEWSLTNLDDEAVLRCKTVIHRFDSGRRLQNLSLTKRFGDDAEGRRASTAVS